MRLGLFIMSLLAVMVGVFIIFNSLSVSVNQRWKEIGVLRAIGVEGSHIQQMFLVEAALMGLVGSALGVGIGFVMARGATRIMSASSPRCMVWFQLPSSRPFIGTMPSPLSRSAPSLPCLPPGCRRARLRASTRLWPSQHRAATARRSPRLVALRSRHVFIVVGLALTFFSPPGVGLMVHFSYSILVQFGMVLLLPKFVVWGSRDPAPIDGPAVWRCWGDCG